MPSPKAFGRRAAPHHPTASEPRAATAIAPETKVVAARTIEPVAVPGLTAAASEQSVDVDRELEEWKAARKIQRRSFREPWRTLSIASAVGFGLSSWLLPDSVSNVAELVTGGLGAASFFAGFRVRAPTRSASSESGD